MTSPERKTKEVRLNGGYSAEFVLIFLKPKEKNENPVITDIYKTGRNGITCKKNVGPAEWRDG